MAALDYGASPDQRRVVYVSSSLEQLVATMKRQLIQKFRTPISLLMEMLLPVLFVLVLIAGNSAAGTDMKPGKSYVLPSDSQTGLVDLAEPSVLIKERFCYNGTRMTAAESSEAVLGGNCADGLLQCNAGVGAAACAGVQLLCTDSYAALKVPSGFCFYSDAIGFTQQFLMGERSSRILDFSAMVLMQWAALIQNNGPNGDSIFDSKTILMSGPINFCPDTAETASLIALLSANIPMFRFVLGSTFASRDAAVNYFTSLEGEGNWALVNLVEMSAEKGLAISLALNRTAVPSTNDVLSRFSGGLGSTGFEGIMDSGFMTIQSEITRLFLTQVLNVDSDIADQSIVVAPMGFQEYRSSTFLQIAGSALAPLMLVLSFLYTVSQLSKRLVEEKELRLREGSMVMGLGKFAFYASWFLTYLLQVLVSSIIITIFVHVGLIKQSAVLIVFFLYFLFSFSTVLLSALLSSFFSKSKIAALVVPLLYFGLAIPSFSLPDSSGAGVYIILSLFSPTAFGVGTRLLFSYEVNDGMGWADVSSTEDTMNMGTVFALLIIDCILYLLLTLYLDEVLPGEWGSKRHPCFCCCICCESKKELRFDAVDSSTRTPIPSKGRTTTYMEEYPASASATVHIQALRKEFGSDSGVKVAVDDLDLKFFPDQITVLLGHNGAGKTTTMNMITGMLSISSGDCVVYGKSSRFDLKEVRNEIGYCPQHNILWDQLTCAEHLRYFAALKGVPSSQIEAQVDEMLNKVDLPDKKDFYSSQLSGGQKRKLSVAIAFIGGSRLILLDEPTAGMDVAARRHTWDLLKEMSKGRTIILTTHFMDEADLLGNRIAIMSKGSLHSYGSSTFLKARLGTGYMLRVSLEPPSSKDDLAAIAKRAQATANTLLKKIQATIPSALLKEAKGQEIAYSLPMKDAPMFAGVVGSLEAKQCMMEHHLSGVSMSVSTLEDVFVRIAEEDHGPGEQPHGEPAHDQSEETVKLLGEVYRRMEVNPCSVTFARQFFGLLMKRFHNTRRDRRTIVLQVIVPLLCILLAMLMSLLGQADADELWIDGSMYSNTEQQIPITGAGLCERIAPNLDTFSTAAYRALANIGNQSYDLSSQLVSEFKAHGSSQRMVALSCTDVGYELTMSSNGNVVYQAASATVGLFNASSEYSLPQVVAAFYNGVAGAYGTAIGATNNVTIRIASHPMPYSARQTAAIDSVKNLLIGIFIMIPFTFIPSTYVAWIVKERQCKAKHLQIVSGMNFIAYWASNFVFDIVSFLVTEILVLIVFAIFGRSEYIGSDAIGPTIVLFILYGLSGIVWAYLFSFLFDNHGSAQNLTMLANFLSGFALVIAMYILRSLDSTEGFADIFVYFCRLIPAYCLGDGILALANGVALPGATATDMWAMDKLGWDILFMAVEVVLFAGATLLWDHPQRQLKKQQLLFDRNAVAPLVAEEDDDVKRERADVEGNVPARQNDVVKVRKLRKVYGNGKVAVQNVTFGVKSGEVFGFLGTNGAGKTTTMSILTSEFLPTMGHCSIGGFDVVEQAAEAQRILGFCPQFDALHDLMTCKEHLQLYAALRGVSLSDTEFVVDALLTSCDIAPFRDVPSKKLSGGNKRKLSVAISLIGAPRLVLLDEPSAGMDPLARRLMWDVINFVARKSSVVLTTHHLEEVDVLAHRVGIMVDGTLRCLGSLDHLKRRFGSGYEVTIKVMANGTENESTMVSRVRDIELFMKQNFPTSELMEHRNERLTFSISSKGTALSRIFQSIQQAKETQSCAIAEYTVQQSSLEQVFLRISEGAEATEEPRERRNSVPMMMEGYIHSPMLAPATDREQSAFDSRPSQESELRNLL
ncbi:ABC transporter, putative [Bodo saltans]|uniref:ABC transporter, putative n=1 Tax=Bodo saltans TaxID=75058 RepID=A0A0S4J9S9_BODSA|nr:ABC transporter, putative [Bodo saltans]|eukprot:CUG86889.1 ABC transporter, putative [Bodo saltans]